MRYKIGDKVKIREDLRTGGYFGDDIANGHMTPHAGKIATVKRVGENAYGIDLDGEMWSWTPEMFDTPNIKEGMMVVKDTGAIGIVGLGKDSFHVRFNDGTWDYVENLNRDKICVYEEVSF